MSLVLILCKCHITQTRNTGVGAVKQLLVLWLLKVSSVECKQTEG